MKPRCPCPRFEAPSSRFFLLFLSFCPLIFVHCIVRAHPRKQQQQRPPAINASIKAGGGERPGQGSGNGNFFLRYMASSSSLGTYSLASITYYYTPDRRENRKRERLREGKGKNGDLFVTLALWTKGCGTNNK